MFKIEEMIERVEKLSISDRELISSSLFYCLNWFREVGKDVYYLKQKKCDHIGQQ